MIAARSRTVRPKIRSPNLFSSPARSPRSPGSSLIGYVTRGMRTPLAGSRHPPGAVGPNDKGKEGSPAARGAGRVRGCSYRVLIPSFLLSFFFPRYFRHYPRRGYRQDKIVGRVSRVNWLKGLCLSTRLIVRVVLVTPVATNRPPLPHPSPHRPRPLSVRCYVHA
jgi:hypothetical protein